MSTGRVDHRFPRLNSAKREETIKEYKSGASFKGKITDYKKVGYGIFTWPNGDRYEGEFVDNVRHGKGKQQWSDGSAYEGEFVQDMRHGSGVHHWANGESYKGHFHKDRRHGRGEYTWPDKSSYSGTFYLDRKEGYGCLTFPDGRKYEGLYKGDEREGPGVLIYPDGTEDVGLWHREQLVRICYKLPEGFTMTNHTEFDCDVSQNTQYLEPETVHNRLDFIDPILNPKDEFNYPPEVTLSPENSFFSDTLDSRSIAADVKSFEQAFFNNVKIEDNVEKKNKANKAKVDNSNRVKSWNNTPSCVKMQLHVLKHRNSGKHVAVDMDKVCMGNRVRKSQKGPLEVASEELLQAALQGDLRMVQELLHSGKVSPDVADQTGHTALMAAAVNWHQGVIHCLLDNGADVNKLNDEGVSPLAACHVFFYPVDRFKYNIAERQLEKPPDFEQEIGYDVNEAVKSILANSPRRRNLPSQEKTPVDTKRIQELKQEYSARSRVLIVEEEDKNGTDSLNGSASEAEFHELMNGDVQEGERKIGMLSIKRTKRPGSRDFLTNEELERDSVQTDRDGAETQVSEFESNASVRNMDIDVPDQLIERCATHLSVNDMVVSRSRSAVSHAESMGTVRRLAVEKSHHALMESTIRLLLNRGADPNASSVPMPVLFCAIKAADVDAVRLLLLKGAHTASRLSEEKGRLAPLHIAAALPGKEGVEITELLLNSLADPDVRAANDDSFLNRLLEEEWRKDTIDGASEALLGGRTPLQIACARDDNYQNARRVVHLLLDHHANPNLLCNGFSPLALAIASGNDLAIDELLAYGADPSLKLTHGVGSALCVATSTEYEHRRTPQDRINLVDKLVKAGTNVLAPIPIGPKRVPGTAVDYAFYMFNLDRRIAHMPYHALTHAERETYNARRRLLAHVGAILRTKAVERERLRLEEDEMDGRRSRSPSPNFVYTGAGAPLPPGAKKGRGGQADGHVSFQETGTGPGGVDMAEARKPLFKYCYECGRSVGVRLSACTRCKEVYYCSKACKLKAWNARHKEECVRVGARSHSPSPTRGQQIDSPTPATDPDRGKPTTVKGLAGEKGRKGIQRTPGSTESVGRQTRMSDSSTKSKPRSRNSDASSTTSYQVNPKRSLRTVVQ